MTDFARDVPTAAPREVAQVRGPWRYVLMAVAWVSLALGLIGMVTPLLPTVPFILLASWAGMRSSQRVHRYLEDHRLFGPILRDWRAHGAVSRRAKWMATASMLAGAVILLCTNPRLWASLTAIGIMATVAVWLWLRPEPNRSPAT